ncbi:MAG: PDZ domain-containing protein [Lachnospiraceae bacterium]
MTEVEADSPAMKAGIQNGDIITHIDKKKIESVIGYHSTMITQDVGTEVTLTGQRRGAEEYVEIHFTVTIGIKE